MTHFAAFLSQGDSVSGTLSAMPPTNPKPYAELQAMLRDVEAQGRAYLQQLGLTPAEVARAEADAGEVLRWYYGTDPTGMIRDTVGGSLHPRVIPAAFGYVLWMMQQAWKVE